MDTAYAHLTDKRNLLDRASRSMQVAEIVRDGILDGDFLPGARLSEPDISAALGVSRNTLREAFRTLVEERLAVHELNRGVFVRIPTAADVSELYQCRRIIECAAVRSYGSRSANAGIERVADALHLADDRAAADDWTGVGSADVEFHKAIASLNGSARIDSLMTTVWNELRVVFHVMEDPTAFHRPYLDRNHQLMDYLLAGDNDLAEKSLITYLDDAQQQILAKYRN